MDKIIEEYITLDFINNEMLFNKRNYSNLLKINKVESGHFGKNN